MLYKFHSFESLLNLGAALLSPSPSNRLDALLLLCKASGLKKEQLIAHITDKVTTNIALRFFHYIGKRKSKIPLAYLLGKKEFYNLKFIVNPAVLIPRPETEGLIDLALKYIDNSKLIRVIDLGTGSGCIAISLLKKSPQNLQIDAIDISKQALKIAKLNAKEILGEDARRIKFKRYDYLSQEINGKYDLVIANPPYVPIEIESELEKDISFEPRIAIFAKNKGLQYYYAIKKLLERNLLISGVALIEIGPQKYEDLYQIFKDSFEIKILPDLTGRDRYLVISPLS
ncbi:MAG TPA: peptide chain release factor N(5)-glutamine methyltransferase [Candidatus Dojkabacteria bacterium]|nr:peptide chain release factor N(5)-glutamine methyltransferase [Candidatus Dojkabacteria bacterium]